MSDGDRAMFIQAGPKPPPEAVPTYESALEAHRNSSAKRPNGGWELILGAVSLWGGLAMVVVGLCLPTFLDNGSPGVAGIGDLVPATAPVLPTFNPWKAPVIWFGAGLSQGGLLLWLIGKVQRALFFLPGRTVTIAEVEW